MWTAPVSQGRGSAMIWRLTPGLIVALLLSLGLWGRDMAASGGWCAADHLLQPLRVLLPAAGEGVDNDGQQHNQQLAHGRRLARLRNSGRVSFPVDRRAQLAGDEREIRS